MKVWKGNVPLPLAETEYEFLEAARVQGACYVPELLGAGVYDASLCPCLVMRDAGPDLDRLCKGTNGVGRAEGPSSMLEDPADLFFNIMLPLYEVHALGFVHLDVKPSNMASKELPQDTEKGEVHTASSKGRPTSEVSLPDGNQQGSQKQQGQQSSGRELLEDLTASSRPHVYFLDFGSCHRLSNIQPATY